LLLQPVFSPTQKVFPARAGRSVPEPVCSIPRNSFCTDTNNYNNPVRSVRNVNNNVFATMRIDWVHDNNIVIIGIPAIVVGRTQSRNKRRVSH
jgi:hypothetical protein